MYLLQEKKSSRELVVEKYHKVVAQNKALPFKMTDMYVGQGANAGDKTNPGRNNKVDLMQRPGVHSRSHVFISWDDRVMRKYTRPPPC